MYQLFFDGACRGNPGPSSVGGVIYDSEKKELDTFSAVWGSQPIMSLSIVRYLLG